MAEHVRLLCDPAFLATTVGVVELDRLILETLRRLSRDVDDPGTRLDDVMRIFEIVYDRHPSGAFPAYKRTRFSG